MIKFIILLAVSGLTIGFIRTAWLSQKLSAWLKIKPGEPAIFSTCVVLVFVLFTALGLTGSSLNLGLRNAPFVDANMKRIWGHEQPIRSDEWLVMTPMAIAQYNHVPRYPVLNTSLGLDGQNMLIVGMAGVPVAHISALARPATWGFFFLDLKRALAWYWWLPVFGCFLALAHLLNTLAPGRWRVSFLFALLFSAAPYVVAWSFWPAYAVMFPCIALLCLLKILQSRRTWMLLPLGVLTGMAGAGFVLLLYPPWQVSVGYVFMALVIGVVVRDRLYRGLTLEPILAILLAVLVTGILLVSWWLSAQDAIGAMMHTVYPGQRHIEVGGGITWPMLLKGYTNLVTVQSAGTSSINQSEIASFHYYLLPLAALFVLRARQRALSAVDISLAVMISLILIYMLVGVGARLSTYSLWSYVTPNRADLALGLASLVLTHLIIHPVGRDAIRPESQTFMAWAIALIWAALVYESLKALDGPVLSGFSSSIMVGMVLLAFACGYFLQIRNTYAFLGLSLGLTLATTLSFHPVYAAPSYLKTHLPDQNSPILTLSTRIPMMFLFASGHPVVNAVFYYPQNTLWKRLDPQGRYVQLHNRYQHLMFVGQSSTNDLQITVPYPDVVSVLITFQSQDFNLTGAGLVAAPDSDSALLSLNPTLALQHSEKGWSWFRVKPAL